MTSFKVLAFLKKKIEFFWVFLVLCIGQFCVGFEGGPKLRKWYGAPDLLPKDGSNEEDEEKEDEFPGNLKWKFLDIMFISMCFISTIA